MNKFWSGLGTHSGQILAITAIFTVALSLLGFAWKFSSKPTITIRVLRNESSIPPSINEWIQGAASFLSKNPPADSTSPDTKAIYKNLIESSERYDLRSYRSADDYGYLYLEVTNDSDRNISDVALRVDHFERGWKADFSGSSLSPDDAIRLENATIFSSQSSVILPVIPILHSQETVKLRLYGDPEFVNVSASANGGSVKLVEYHLDEDSFWLWWARSSAKFLTACIILMLIMVVLSLRQQLRAKNEA